MGLLEIRDFAIKQNHIDDYEDIKMSTDDYLIFLDSVREHGDQAFDICASKDLLNVGIYGSYYGCIVRVSSNYPDKWFRRYFICA